MLTVIIVTFVITAPLAFVGGALFHRWLNVRVSSQDSRDIID